METDLEVSADNHSGCVASYVDGATSIPTIDCLRSFLIPKHHGKKGGSLMSQGNVRKKERKHVKTRSSFKVDGIYNIYIHICR